jgi:hypothetical protein
MKYMLGGFLVILSSISIGIWLDYTLPHYGDALGTGMALAFLIGVFTDINK